ncbi:hypothetical protein PRIPAC_73291 [Pristionchus pacificus]|uniref:Uncharacterized protein n=1 Tax=Pristionchus pacificus TaxID=54126 RepID=A0A2A6BEV9_PRIPA|nr:hypothetical protein PRIPAC_73291 [Pristionchus pacificus]|eukprot:PDM64419.1 hypothetical protein PRIPAC_52675 [Pristionchus pacificus]
MLINKYSPLLPFAPLPPSLEKRQRSSMMIYCSFAVLSILFSSVVESRTYPQCKKWCGKDSSSSSSSSSSSHEHHRENAQQSCNSCPNVQGKQDCLQFDPSMYASSIDEALYNFPNLVSNDKKTMFNKVPPPSLTSQQTMQQQDIDIFGPSIMSAPPPPMPDSPIDPTAARGYGIQSSTADVVTADDCSDVSCRSCKLHVINGFLAGPVDPATNASLWATKESLEATLNGITPSCPQNACPQTPPKRGRGKRENGIVEQDPSNLLGTTQTISCDYTRGNPVTTDTRFCGLCSLCWGFGKCNAVTRSINVLRKKFDAKGGFTYEQTTIDTVTSCECQVEYGSTIFNLVYANDAPK